MTFLVVQDTNVTPLAHRADVVLAGATFAEKAGCYVNADGRLQYSEAALATAGRLASGPRSAGDSLESAGRGPVDSSTVLAELAERIPAFSVAKGGKLPAHGVVLGRADRRPTAAPVPPSFTDTWFLAHGAGRVR